MHTCILSEIVSGKESLFTTNIFRSEPFSDESFAQAISYCFPFYVGNKPLLYRHCKHEDRANL